MWLRKDSVHPDDAFIGRVKRAAALSMLKAAIGNFVCPVFF